MPTMKARHPIRPQLRCLDIAGVGASRGCPLLEDPLASNTAELTEITLKPSSSGVTPNTERSMAGTSMSSASPSTSTTPFANKRVEAHCVQVTLYAPNLIRREAGCRLINSCVIALPRQNIHTGDLCGGRDVGGMRRHDDLRVRRW
jgi:hypothetical protein